MYEQYWNLAANPFADEHNPDFFFRSRTHQATLLKMRYLVENRKGAGLLVGGTGCGKSFLAGLLEREIPNFSGPIVQLLYPQMSASELLDYLAVELGADESSLSAGMDRTVHQIERHLQIYARDGHHPVIVIDDAHLIEDVRIYQSLQLLLNFIGTAQIHFSLLLLGERSLLSQVARVPQLDARIAVRALLQPLSRDETAQYVAHRLRAAGREQPVFEAHALDTLFELSGGVPRRINRLCDMGLLVGYAEGLSAVSADDVEAVAEELTAVVPD